MSKKQIVSITEMAQILNLSRARFYQLLEQGILPQPIYDLRTHRPMYNAELQQQCLEIRETGIAANNQYHLFYSPRKKDTNLKMSKKIDPLYQEYMETLNGMGLKCSIKEVSKCLSELYPQGIEGLDNGVIIRELFRFLKSK